VTIPVFSSVPKGRCRDGNLVTPARSSTFHFIAYCHEIMRRCMVQLLPEPLNKQEKNILVESNDDFLYIHLLSEKIDLYTKIVYISPI
jgi:hypothetical protein